MSKILLKPNSVYRCRGARRFDAIRIYLPSGNIGLFTLRLGEYYVLSRVGDRPFYEIRTSGGDLIGYSNNTIEVDTTMFAPLTDNRNKHPATNIFQN